MKLAIMQPYFLPYIGYFQLIGAVDVFIVYDNIKYTKKGWINRNRMLQNHVDVMFSLPLKKASDSLHVRERELAAGFCRDDLLRQLSGAYRRAPQFESIYTMLEQVVRHEDGNLFNYIHNSIVCICNYLSIRSEIIVASDVDIDHTLKGQDKVIALCEAIGADNYVNAIGGVGLYDRMEFAKRGIDLKFIKAKPFEYEQYGSTFVPWLSIVDVLMFNPIDVVRSCITKNYELI